MVHITDVKITLMEQVAYDYENLGKQGRFSKKCIPRGYIPDFNWTTIHKGQDPPIKPIQQQDPTEDTTAPAQEIEDLQVPLDHEDTENPLDHKDLWDHRDHLDKLLDSHIYLAMFLNHE